MKKAQDGNYGAKIGRHFKVTALIYRFGFAFNLLDNIKNDIKFKLPFGKGPGYWLKIDNLVSLDPEKEKAPTKPS